MTTTDTSTTQQEIQPSSWPLQRVGLRVQHMKRSIAYYQRLGLKLVRDERDETGNGSVGLGVGSREVLQLRTLPGGRPRPARTAGLYHFALVVPTEAELGAFLLHVQDAHNNVPLGGEADHLVSEALYLTDPEGNGIEVYYDRPRTQWPYRGDQLLMDTLYLNRPHLIAQASASFTGFSDSLRLGHMHLNVSDLEQSLTFYKSLGMQPTVKMKDQAYFISWDGYHHHLGTNLWAGRNVSPVEPDMYGIDFYEIKRPGLTPMTIQDPNGVTIVVL
ncbi:VOC family protein [Dictyobacter arantiisoli]|uniref:Glyoxalase/bleomycin resistance protein/dioxygenase n=1 Tax=Dictyobacter arantiisoli TaxID=2014874 RepID=A0A5A5TBS7_9CHLR|nr:VOC family protein [Dictyobacter arantiisoli]GCF08941.1 glyoxalase/bleomycin resistance protein/dioxygenase [Dictyobacter arantiisoli]